MVLEKDGEFGIGINLYEYTNGLENEMIFANYRVTKRSRLRILLKKMAFDLEEYIEEDLNHEG